MSSTTYMTKLLKEAEVKFEEKFDAARKGEPVSVAGQYTDRAYSLRSCIQGQATLEKDQHLVTMIEEVEKYSNTDFTMKGDTHRKLVCTVAGILKGLLRETLSSTEVSTRKINIEKCWNWYKEKIRTLLDWKLERQDAAEGGVPPSGSPEDASQGTPRRGSSRPSATSPECEEIELWQGRMRKRKPHVNPVINAYGGVPLDFMSKSADAQEKTGITKKLERRLELLEDGMKARKDHRLEEEMIRAEQARAAERDQPFAPDAPESPNKDAAAGGGEGDDAPPKPAARSRWRKRETEIPPPPPPPPPPPQYPRVVYKKEKLGGEKSKGPPSFLHGRNAVAPEVEAMTKNEKGEVVSEVRHKTQELLGVRGEGVNKGKDWSEIAARWIRNEGAEVDEELVPLEKAIANANKLWVANRARQIEESLEEKEFKDTMTLWSYNRARVEEEIHRRQESSTTASQIGRTHHLILTKDATNRPADDGVKRPATSGSASIWTGLGHSCNPDGTVNASLSASDHRLPTGYERMLLDREEATIKKTHDTPMEDTFKKYGIRPIDAEHLVGTAGTTTELDVTVTSSTAFAPSIDRATYRPPRAVSAPPGAPGGGGKKKGKKKGGGKKKPSNKKKDDAAAGGGPAKAETEEELQRKAALFQWLFPTMTTIESVPSVKRMKELKTLEKVKVALSRAGIAFSTSELEEGLLTPEYEPYLDCIRNLPSRAMGFTRNWEKLGTAGKSGGGKKSKKKK